MNEQKKVLIINGIERNYRSFIKFQEIIGEVIGFAKLPRPMPPIEDSFWSEWSVTFRGGKSILTRGAELELKSEGILHSESDLFCGEKTIINAHITGNA